ncbi:MAG: hypothetical protein R3D67_01920 [Hyphomicrobiaceae bacterium]
MDQRSVPGDAAQGREPDGRRFATRLAVFFDCGAEHVMECLPTCTGPGNPPKYEPIDYVSYMTWFRNMNYAGVAKDEKGGQLAGS